ncbi:LPXTG cell wall anchor domain-containing protein [Dactylosporangium sp. NPDC048998]|uniref:LPXTG cell wall anchor domain-containing protein n=1 Tax=Dactylosporangium sp. NPDC048998 TaxID=3363976 RepID=UPI0037204D98
MSRRIPTGAALLAVAAALALLTACGKKEERVPYHDERSTGAIVLYGADGKAKTSGKLSDKPFVAKAVSQAAAPAPYDGEGRKATLLAYQPRENVSPELWAGTFLTGANAYSDAAHPTVEAPEQGFSLGEFIKQYPTRWNGLVQLRIYLGVPNEPTLNSSYATADLKVEGDTWTLLSARSDAAARPRPADGLRLALGAPARDEGVPIMVNVSGSPMPSTTPTGPPGGGDLPRTGLNILFIVGVGIGLVALGAAVLVAARRRNARIGSRS